MFGKKNKKDVSKKIQDKKPQKKSEDHLDLTHEDNSNIFEKNKRTLKDLIAPDSLEFTNPYHGRIGDKYFFKSMYIGLLPESVNFASFLHDLYTISNIDTSIFINPIDPDTAKADLSKVKTSLEMEFYSAKGSNRADDMEAKVVEAKRIREEVRDGLNKLYECSIIATLFENDERTLNNTTDQLKSLLGQTDVGLRSATFAQEDAFFSNKPLMDNKLGEWHPFDKRSLACIFPFTSNNINHETGLPLGFNKDNGLPINYDTFHISLPNYNAVCFGKSGGGKSTLFKQLSSRSSTIDRIQNISIDIEPEYNDVCLTLGGSVIKIAPETDTIINPFDVVVDKEENSITKKEEEKILLAERINGVTSVLMTMAKGTIGNNPFYNDITKGIIKEAVKAEYDRIGITNEPESLYRYEEDSVVGEQILGGKIKKEMPTISTFYIQLSQLSEKNTNDTYRPYYDYLLMIFKDYCKITNGSFTCFDGQTTVKLGYDIPFINFDVSALNEKTELPIAQHIITNFIWEQMVKRNTSGHKIRVIIDEAWRMVKCPDALDFLITGFRRARKKNTSFVVISQQFHEFYSEETRPIIENSATKIFLPPDPITVDSIQEVFKLTQGQTDFLRTCQTGEALIMVKNLSAKLIIEVPQFEKDFIETNQNAIRERMYRRKG